MMHFNTVNVGAKPEVQPAAGAFIVAWVQI